MEIFIIIVVALVCLFFILFLVAKNKYTRIDETTGEIKKHLSSELLEQIEEANNLYQVNKARVDLKAADISPLTKTALFSLLKSRRELLLKEQADFGLNERGDFTLNDEQDGDENNDGGNNEESGNIGENVVNLLS